MTAAETRPSDGPEHAPSVWNIANVLTVLRIVGVPVFGWLLLTHGGRSESFRFWSWVAFALLMVTDKIDGDLARRHNLVTNFGKIADPIADKALTGMAFVGVSINGQLWWWVTIVVLLREWGITVMRFVVIRYGVMPASRGGKLKTMLQALALGGYCLPLELWDTWYTMAIRWVTHGLMAAALVVTLVTGVEYVRDAIVLRREARAVRS